MSAAPAPADAPPCLPPRPAGEGAPLLPAGSTDCHCHVFEDPARYPLTPARSYTPAPASLDGYLAMCDALGIQRTVQVNASVYGNDNRITLDLIRELGQHRARGVAGLAADVSHGELEALHEGGFRGVRVSTHVQGYGGTDHIEDMARRIKPFGWHLQIHVAHSRELAGLEDRLMRIDAPLVFDHLGCARGEDGVAGEGFQALLRLLSSRDDCWAKISSWYRRSGDAEWDDMRPLAQAMAACRPDRLLFGTNWPHPNLFRAEDMPDDRRLVSAFLSWVPDPEVQRQILVRNPEALYGFPSVQ